MNKPFLTNTPRTLLLIIALFAPLQALDRAHFYATNPIWQEPRLEKNWLFSLDVAFYDGTAKDCCDACSECRPGLLDLYGTYNMHLVGQNVPLKDPNTYPDSLLILLSRIPSREKFGHLSFDGLFNATQTEIMLTQNFKRGLFFQIHIPIRSLEIGCISYEDLSPSGPDAPNKNNPLWKAFLTDFDTILERYNLDIGPYKKTHIGDVSFLVGWTKNNEETTVLDFFDSTIKIGVLTPTGQKRCPDKVFSLPHGYDGHIGIPIVFDMAAGLYEWITFAAHLDALFLLKKTKELRMKTAREQSGFIKLAKGNAQVQPGLLINVGGSIKADHFAGGLSILFGYSYTFKNDDKIHPCNTSVFDPFVACDDEMFKKWDRHTLHFGIDYDFTREEWRAGPRVGFFYNWQLKGSRVFKTNTVGATLGLDIAFEF